MSRRDGRRGTASTRWPIRPTRSSCETLQSRVSRALHRSCANLLSFYRNPKPPATRAKKARKPDEKDRPDTLAAMEQLRALEMPGHSVAPACLNLLVGNLPRRRDCQA